MPAQIQSLAEVAIAIGLEEARRGVFENANDNRGARIDEYQLEANRTVGEKWCAKFAWWCFEKAAQRLKVKNPFPRIFAAAALETWALREKKIVPDPARGVIFVKSHRHVALATGPLLSGGFVPALEGNTWTGTVRKDGVYETKKTKASDCVFIRM